MSRRDYRKGGTDHDEFWQRLRERLENPPTPRFLIFDFVLIEATGTIAYFSATDTRTGYVLGRCRWCSRPTEHTKLPAGIHVPDADFHTALLASVRGFARDLITKGEVLK